MEKVNLYTSNFKKIAQFIGVVLPLFFLVSICVEYFFEKEIIFGNKISGASKINRMLNVSDENEIPIFGSSRAQGGFVPDLISAYCYNYGIDGTGDNVILFFLENELKKEKNTPIIINFDLNGISDGYGDNNNYVPFSNNKAIDEVFGKRLFFYQKISGIKYYGEFENYLKYYLNDIFNLTKKTNKGGSFELNVDTISLSKEIKKRKRKEKYEIINNQVLYEKYIELIKSTNRNIIFVVAPIHQSYFYSIENIEIIWSFFAEIEKNENVFIFNFSKENYSNNLFFNTTHINYEGAKIFSKSLRDSLSKYYILPQQHN